MPAYRPLSGNSSIAQSRDYVKRQEEGLPPQRGLTFMELDRKDQGKAGGSLPLVIRKGEETKRLVRTHHRQTADLSLLHVRR